MKSDQRDLSALPLGEGLVAALRERGDVARKVSFYTDFYALHPAAQRALDGLAALVERAADELERVYAAQQLTWIKRMEEVEKEVFPDSRPRSEVIVEVEE